MEDAAPSLELMPNENGSSRLDRIEQALKLLPDDRIHSMSSYSPLRCY
jgi:hypothetical protein